MRKNKIVRRKDRAEGGITDAERIAMAESVKEWTAIAYRTEPIDPEKIIPAIHGLYKAADLKGPRVVIAQSPMQAAFIFGAAAAYWWVRKNPEQTLFDFKAVSAATRFATRAATDDATEVATRAATDAATHAATDAATRFATHAATNDATYDATHAATDDATYDATDDATRFATRAATYDATDAATRAATHAATNDATYDATRAATDDATEVATRAATDAATHAATDDATDAATHAATDDATDAATRAATYDATYDATRAAALAATRAAMEAATEAAQAMDAFGAFILECAKRWGRCYQGGNMWVSWDCYLTAARHILGLELGSHEKYKFWETCAREGGLRILHEEFCVVSDFPEFIKIDAENRPHCEDGPSHRWRDGWEIFHWRGIQVPARWIMDKESLTAQEALTEDNIEKRRAACEILGWDKILEELDARVIDHDTDPEIGDLLEVQIPDIGREKFLRVKCGTGRTFALPVPPEMSTALEANAWTYGFDADSFPKPEVRT